MHDKQALLTTLSTMHAHPTGLYMHSAGRLCPLPACRTPNSTSSLPRFFVALHTHKPSLTPLYPTTTTQETRASLPASHTD